MLSVMAVTESAHLQTSSASTPTQVTKRKCRADPIASDNNDTLEKPNPIELQVLFLPSELSIQLQSTCHPGLDEIEHKMRDAQCWSSLDHIRTLLYIKSSLHLFKTRNARAQKQNTCAHATLDQNDTKIKVFQDKYNTARMVLIILGADEATLEWKKVENGDLWCLEDPEELVWKNKKQRKRAEQPMKAGKRDTLGEGHRKLSWIWEGTGVTADADVSTGMHECKPSVGRLCLISLITNPALHVQWAKSRARARGWTKEAQLLKEEMRRVLVTLEWKVVWWADWKEAED